MSGRAQSNVGDALGFRVAVNGAETFIAFDAMPPRCRKRLADSTLPLDPITLADFYRRIVAAGYETEFAEAHVIKAITDTEKDFADKLARERETWTLGEDMAAAMKAAHSRRMGR